MKRFGVIMAGGGGTRFWPLSTKKTPKQLLNLSGKDVMVNETIKRLLQVIDKDDIYIVTNRTQKAMMVEVTKGLINPLHILAEPSARNTSACIGFAATRIIKEKGDGVLVVTPSDAYIKDEEKYASILEEAFSVVEKKDGIVTIGITPTSPSTGYGYIKYEPESTADKKVIRFVEKPDEEKAKQYLAEGGYAWNAGIFVWKASTILNKFQAFLPDINADLKLIEAAIGTKMEEETLETVYPHIRSISVDYGIMEKSDDIRVLLGEFGWNDVGSWDMLKAIHDEDEDGNIKIGESLTIETTNSIIYSTKKIITTVGIDNLVIVESPEAIMICHKDKAQDVKKIVDALKDAGKDNFL